MADRLLLEDGSSASLLEDGSSALLLESPGGGPGPGGVGLVGPGLVGRNPLVSSPGGLVR